MKKDFKKLHTESFPIIVIPLELLREHYYIDPGTGSLIIQVLIGALVGGWFIVKNYSVRIKLFLTRLFKLVKKDDNPKA